MTWVHIISVIHAVKNVNTNDPQLYIQGLPHFQVSYSMARGSQSTHGLERTQRSGGIGNQIGSHVMPTMNTEDSIFGAATQIRANRQV